MTLDKARYTDEKIKEMERKIRRKAKEKTKGLFTRALVYSQQHDLVTHLHSRLG